MNMFLAWKWSCSHCTRGYSWCNENEQPVRALGMRSVMNAWEWEGSRWWSTRMTRATCGMNKENLRIVIIVASRGYMSAFRSNVKRKSWRVLDFELRGSGSGEITRWCLLDATTLGKFGCYVQPGTHYHSLACRRSESLGQTVLHDWQDAYLSQ